MDELLWDSRLSWSSEVPLSWPGLSPVALNRVDNYDTGLYRDAVDTSRDWRFLADGSPQWWGSVEGPRGLAMRMNEQDPAAEQGRVQLDHFSGLWPSSGRLLVAMWVRQNYTMSFNPLIDTRDTDPFVYLSTSGSSGNPRHQVYDASGSLIFDHYETDFPWAQTSAWYFLGYMVDLDAPSSRMFSVHSDGRTWLGPVRTFSGTPNTSCTADVHVFSLRHAGYWESGHFDEALIAHPTSGFDLAGFVEAMGRSVHADGQRNAQADRFDVTDTEITATTSATLATGAEAVSWDDQPVADAPAGATPLLSADDGDTWETEDPDDLPETFSGLMRWEVPLASSETFSGITLHIPQDPPPELDPIDDVALEQGGLHTAELTYQAVGPVWSVSSSPMVTATVDDGTLSVAAGFEVGTGTVTVTLADEHGRSTSEDFEVTVTARDWDTPPPPVYPHAPVILWDDDAPQQVLIDPLKAIVTGEVNGAETFELEIPATHRHADLIQPERIIEAAGERYWVRRITTERRGRTVVLVAYCEARFYELATAGTIGAQDFEQVTAGAVMEQALEGTGWTVEVANVTTLRTYSVERTNPLGLLRTVQQNHGGDMVFDNTNRRVSLVTQSGRDQGVSFLYGRGITDAKRVVDTTSLITRIIPVNEDGVGIESVNDGSPHLEDYSYTDEVRQAVYTFASGTSPHTMLSMATATLGNRSRPDRSYELTVQDLSAQTGDQMDRFDVGDFVTVADPEVGIEGETQRIVKLEYDLLRPWATRVTLSAKLRETGSSETQDAGTLTTGAGNNVFDMVPFNLLRNGRFDNDLAHWANLGAQIVETTRGTGDQAVRFTGGGTRWIEQTVQPDNRAAYALSFDVRTSGGPSGWSPDLTALAEVTYEDGTSETIEIELS